MKKLHLQGKVLVSAMCLLLAVTSVPAISESQNPDQPPAGMEQEAQPGMDMIEVTDAASLLAAIQPNRTIRLLPGDYNFSTLIENKAVQTQQDYADCTDGAITIRNVTNLTITANEPQEIYTENLRDIVISFENCSQVTVTGISFGHHKRSEQQCFSGVMWLSQCSDFVFSACDFYGCGYSGPSISSSNAIEFSHCTIRDCSTSALDISGCSDIQFDHTEVYGICTDGRYPSSLFQIDNSKNVSFNTCNIHDNGCEETNLITPMFMLRQPSPNSIRQMSMTDCTMDNNPYAYSEIKQLSGNIPQNINSLWNLSQMLGNIDNLLTSAYFQAMQDAPQSWQEYALLYAKNDTAITLQWNADHSACVALVGASETVQEQFQAAFQTLMEEIPDVYHRLSANALTIFAQVTDSQAAESLAYGDGLFLFQCTKKQEKKLGKNGIYDLIYCALANAAGKQVFLDANSIILQNEGTDITGKALAIDLATGVNTLQLSASVLPEQAQQTVTWLSSNDAIATVSDTGLVTAIKPGKVTISATTTDGTKKKATCKIKIIDATK